MWLDADDIIPEKSRVALIELKKRLTDEDVVKMPYAVGFDSEDKPTYVFERERILRNCPQAKWAGFIHECIASFGKIVTEEILIEHRKIHAGDSDRNLRIYEKHIADGAKLNPRDMFYFARELYYHNRNQEAIDVFTAFLDSRKGWIENNIEACKLRAKCFNNLKDRKNALKSLFESFLFDNPRAEICCDIGLNFFEEKEYKQAIFWYETALKQEPNAFSGGFVLPECYGYIPALQLCVCYSRLGENKKAFEYNEIGAKYKVTPAITFNRKYFESTGLIMSNV
jgi:tetratricopeptide (TPR) repeat protein